MRTLESFFRKLQTRILKKPVLSMTLVIIAFAGIQGLFSFCSERTCAAFSDMGFDFWFPDPAEKDMYFTSGSGIDTFSFYSRERTESYKAGSGTTAMPCQATVYYGWRRKADPSFVYAASATKHEGEEDMYYLMLSTVKIAAKTLYLTEGFQSPSHVLRNKFYDVYTLSGRSFEHVQELIVDTLGIVKPSISHIYLGKKKGLIGFITYPAKQLWVKQ